MLFSLRSRSISNLNPDLDEDGHVEPWEREVFDELKKRDIDGNGMITRAELFRLMLQTMAEKVKEAERGGIAIDALNPDTNGDGRIDMFEAEVFSRLQVSSAPCYA